MTGPEVMAAMKAEDVDAGLVEKAMWAVAGEQPACAECGENGPAACVYCKDEAEKYARHALAAVLPEIQAQALEAARDMLVAASDRGLEAGHKNYARATRDAAAAVAQMARAARLTATTEDGEGR